MTTLQTTNNTQSEQTQEGTQPVAEPTTDRTKDQFEKLTSHNSELNTENARMKAELDAFKNTPTPTAPIVPQQSQTPTRTNNLPKEIDLNSFVEIDPKTGERFVNETKLTSAISDLQTKTSKAEETIQSFIKTNEDRRIEQQKNEAFNAYPELSPEGEKFDKTFYRTVRSVLYDSMMNADEYGKTLSLKEAADYVKKEIIKTSPTANAGELEKEDAKAASAAKASAGTMVPSQPQNVVPQTSDDELRRLRMATRKGNVDALAQRILNTDYVLNKD